MGIEGATVAAHDVNEITTRHNPRKYNDHSYMHEYNEENIK